MTLQEQAAAKLMDELLELREKVARQDKELRVRRDLMSREPFCPDHRDKVQGLPCRECEIERLNRLLSRAKERMDRARAILTSGRPSEDCNWGMLETTFLEDK